jgi:hypothetical protein
MMSLLSHDEYEVEYEFVDTHNGIKTHSNVLRGWPVMIFAQAVDYSHHKRYAEIQRRFPVTNPRMDEEKYKAAIQLIIHRGSVPRFLYQKTVVSDYQKDQAREIIKGLKERIMDISTTTEPGSNNVFIPFADAISQSLATKKSSDMTMADRIIGYLTLLAQVNVEDRPVIIYREKGNPVTQKIPLATFADLKEALFLLQYSNGVRPYVLQWYYDVFLPMYKEKTDVDSKPSSDGRYMLKESRIAVTTQQLADATFNKKDKKLSTRYVREIYLEQLINQGYIDSVSSELDKRTEIYFPVIEPKETISTLVNSIQIEQYTEYTFFCPISYFPTPNYLKSKILALLEYNDENTICEIKNNLDVDSIIESYYNNPHGIFKTDDDDSKCDIPNSNSNSNDDASDESQTDVQQQQNDGLQTHKLAHDLPSSPTPSNDNAKNNFSQSRVSGAYLNGAQNETSLANEDQKYEKNENMGYSVYCRISEYQCYYCDFKTDDEHNYENHVVLIHDRPAYPNEAEIEKSGLEPQGKKWEI